MSLATFRAHPLLPALAAAVTVFGIAALVRYQLVEPQRIGLICDGGDGPWWCTVRMALVLLFRAKLLGVVAIAAGLGAHWWERSARPLAWTGLLCGAAALMLYNVLPGAFGFLLALLALARGAGWSTDGHR